jgi:hypothetical protein
MSVNESSATALVRFTGLGIICFNDEQQRGEIAVIRDDKHQISIRIQRPVYQDGAEQDLVVYRDIAAYEQLPKENVVIEIKASRDPSIAGYEIYQPGDFDRLGSADVNDFRWIVSMASLHGETPVSPTGQRPYPLTKLYVGNALFYAHKLDRNLFFEKVEKDESDNPLQRETFGNVAETIGARIEAEEVSVTLRIGDREETHLLQRLEGLPFRIEIKNMDYGANTVYSDMPDYYKYLAPAGHQFELVPVRDEAAGGESVNQEDFCHPLGGDLHSIDEL